MKFVKKTYLLLVILIGIAAFNLLLLFTMQQESTKDSISLIAINDLKVEMSNIAALASSIAAGNEADRSLLQQKIGEVDSTFRFLEKGGVADETEIVSVPTTISDKFIHIYNLWTSYKSNAHKIEMEPVFNSEVRESISYVLTKNPEFILYTKQIIDELSTLDRNYLQHQEIAESLTSIIERINEDVLLISLGDDTARSSLTEHRIMYDVNLRKLLGIPLDDSSLNESNVESLSAIPEESSFALKQIDPLWESIRYRILIIESNSLVSEKFGIALRQLNQERTLLTKSLDGLYDSWNDQIEQEIDQRQYILQIMTIIDIVVFVIVIFIIRKSLFPLQKITSALVRVKEGKYGEKITHDSKDEIGDLINTFNTMSQTIKEREDDARKIDIAKDEFLAMITHELKTPLVPIQGYADILLTERFGNLNEKQKERLSVIKESSTSLLQLINDLLDAQRLELGKLRMKMITHNVDSIISKAIDTMLPKIKDAKLQIRHIKAGGLNIACDKERILQVLTNLIKNSIEAIYPNSGTIEISVTNFLDKIQFAVKDNGQGVPKESVPYLFDKFYQADSSLTREKGGSGLGLAICKGIIDAHSGDIWVEQKPNEVVFYFTIPKNLPETS
ncbi:MAG: sensor histidine kinase [Nitrososphaerota archaeon]